MLNLLQKETSQAIQKGLTWWHISNRPMYRTFTRIALYTRMLLVNDLRLSQRLSDTILVSYSIYSGKKKFYLPIKPLLTIMTIYCGRLSMCKPNSKENFNLYFYLLSFRTIVFKDDLTCNLLSISISISLFYTSQPSSSSNAPQSSIGPTLSLSSNG